MRRERQGNLAFFSPIIAILAALLFSVPLLAETKITLANGHQYELVKRLGKGSFGDVYEAKSIPGGESVAIKLYSNRDDYNAESSAPRRQLFRSEAKEFVVKTLDHGVIKSNTRIPTTSGYDAVGAIVMEKVDGTLADISHFFQIGNQGGECLTMEESSFQRNAERIHNLTYQLIKLWAGMASNDLIDNDIKPENIGYVGDPLQIKLLDLGSMLVGPLRNSDERRVLRSKNFHAPELSDFEAGNLKDGEFYSSFADLYSISKTLLRLICDGCDREELSRLVNQWRRKLPNTKENRKAVASLLFANDFIQAAGRRSPKDRFLKLRDGPIGKFLKFTFRGSSARYVDSYPRLRESSEDVLAAYLERVGKRVGPRPPRVRVASRAPQAVVEPEGEVTQSLNLAARVKNFCWLALQALARPFQIFRRK